MNLSTILSGLGEPECYDAILPEWELSLATLPPAGPPFAELKRLLEYRELAGIGREVDAELAAASALIQGSPGLRALLWHCHQCAYVYAGERRFDGWPDLGAFGDLRGVFYLIIALALVPLIQTAHGAEGFPDQVTRATMSAPASFLDRYRRGSEGRTGVFRCELWWLRNYVEGGIVRIGRFEYRPYPFGGGVRVYRRRGREETIALSEEGVRFDSTGLVEWDQERPDPRGWRSRLVRGPDSIVGTPISPNGRALPREVGIDLHSWREVLVPGESRILDMHIPSGGAMTPSAVSESLQGAAELFTERLGSSGFAGFSCISWVFSPHLTEILAPSSNIITFMGEVYLFPVVSRPGEGLFFVFSDPRFYDGGLDIERLRAIVPKSSLEEGVRRHILDTGTWHGGGMFLLSQDLPRLGTQFYRSRWQLDDDAINKERT